MCLGFHTMPRLLLSFLLLVSLPAHFLGATVADLAHQRILVLGDSITQDGRYVSFLEYYLRGAGVPVDLISIGLSSETVSGLTEPGQAYPRPWALERLDRALQAVKPTVVFACYGMNDGIYHPPSPERLAAFSAGLHQLITKVRATGAMLILITPPTFDPQPVAAKTVPATAERFGYNTFYVGYDDVLAEFARTELALNESGVSVIDVHTPMASTLANGRQHDPAYLLSPDGVHPGDLGHLLMARVIAGGLGLVLPSVQPQRELERIATDPLFTLIRDRRTLRSEVWLPFVGYTRGETYKSASVKAAETAAAHLLREIEAVGVK